MTVPSSKTVVRVALYARYSSELQSAASIEDQIRTCEAYANRQGWQAVATYEDRAISGASLIRPGLQKLQADANRGNFDVVVAEGLDRISRDQEDIAGFFKRLRFEGVKLVTCSEGEINELHVGLKGTMNALFLKDLAAKTHRGLEGRIRKGMSAGGLTFGYDVAKGGDDGSRGARTVNADQAATVVRIFSEFSEGMSPNAIVRRLNAEKIPGPGGRPWLDTTIRGHALRGTGILRNELYVGRLIWNRLRYVKDPASGQRRSRLNPRAEWVVEDVPHLRIVDGELWQRVASRLDAIRNDPVVLKRIASRPVELRRPAHFLTGRVVCGVCGKPMARIGKDYLGCNFARRRGTCSNKVSVRQSILESAVLEGLKNQVMAPDLVRDFVDALHKELNSQRGEETARRSSAARELATLDARIGKLVDAIASGVRSRSVLEALESAEVRKVELEKLASHPRPSPVRLHPRVADLYRSKVADLHGALQDPDLRTEATQIIRSLIDEIIVTDGPTGVELELVGDLAMMVALGSDPERKKAALIGAALSLTEQRSVKVVAGAGFEPTTFRL